MRHAHGETVTVTRRGELLPDEFDGQGNPIIGPDATFDISDVAVAPTGSTETVDSPGIFVVTGFDLYCPYGTPQILPTDRIEVRGVPGWQVTGDTAASGWRNPFDGIGRGVVINVKRAS